MLTRSFVPPTQRTKAGHIRKRPIFHAPDAPVLNGQRTHLEAALLEVKGEPAEAALMECVAILKDAAEFCEHPPPPPLGENG